MEKNQHTTEPTFMGSFSVSGKTALFASLLALTLAGCASPGYRLKPTSEKPEYREGVALETRVTPKCVFQAGFQDSSSEELLILTRITVKSGSLEIDPERFSIQGATEILEDSPIVAKNPDQHVQSLKSSAELFESRARMETHQGIEELATLSAGKSDSAIQEARVAYRRKQNEAEAASQRAASIRTKIGEIQGRLLRKNTLKEGETLEGILVIPSRFKDPGLVQLVSSNEGCEGNLEFNASKR
jgi:hypothetical protein